MNVGGPSWHVTILSTRLGPEYETRLLVGEAEAVEGSMIEAAEAAGADTVRVPGLKRKPSPLDDIRATVWLYRYFRAWRPSIVATHMAKAGALGRVAAFLAQVPVRVHTFHGHVLEGYFGRLTTRFYIQVERLLDRLTTRFIAISPQLATDLNRMGIGGGRTSLIRLGFDLERFREPQKPGGLRSSLGIARDPFLVGIVGRLTPIKAHRVFLEMAAEIQRRRDDVEFVIVGDGELGAQLRDAVQAVGLNHVVHFAGWRRDLESVYRDLDVVVCCSINEGTPVSVIEACAAGTPVVATDVGGMRDVISTGVTGFLVPRGDHLALASAVIRVLDEPAASARMAQAARISVSERYSADRLVRDITGLYRELTRPGLRAGSPASRDSGGD